MTAPRRPAPRRRPTPLAKRLVGPLTLGLLVSTAALVASPSGPAAATGAPSAPAASPALVPDVVSAPIPASTSATVAGPARTADAARRDAANDGDAAAAPAFERLDAPLPVALDEGAQTPEPLAADAAKKALKLQNKLAKTQDKLANAELELAAWQNILATAEADFPGIELEWQQALADYQAALALPADTPEQILARKLAIKEAKANLKAKTKAWKKQNKLIKKAGKKITKWSNKIDKFTAKIAALTLALEQLEDPDGEEPDPEDPILPPSPALLGTDGEGAVGFRWDNVPGAVSYTLYYDTSAGVDPATATAVLDAPSPFILQGLPAGVTYHAIVVAVAAGGEESLPSNEEQATSLEATAGPPANSQYEPPWADVAPTNTIVLDYDPVLSQTENGAILRTTVLGLGPGDRLEVGGGTWSIVPKFSPAMVGTAEAPIWVVAKDGETPVITRPDASQNVMNPDVRYVAFRGLEFTGGSAGIKINDSQNLWIDDCHIHHVGEAGIAANSHDTAFLYITRNHIHHTAGYGEGMYLGANNSAHVMSESVIALNHVHDTTGTLQGDGIEVKQGSWGNWIAENTVHDTKYPALLVYGTDGNPPNLIERNVLIGSQDNTLQVQGEATVRSNLIIDGATALQSGDHQGTVTDLVIVHNTIINSGQAVRLSDWNAKPGMVFANNAVYTGGSTAVQFPDGSSGVTISGNVVSGGVSGAAAAGFALGNGLADFTSVSWAGLSQDPTPAVDSPLLGAGDPTWAVGSDLQGDGFGVAPAAGCAAADS